MKAILESSKVTGSYVRATQGVSVLSPRQGGCILYDLHATQDLTVPGMKDWPVKAVCGASVRGWADSYPADVGNANVFCL